MRDSDLTWYYNCREAALGLRSTYGSLLRGTTQHDPEPSDADLEAVARERQIRLVLSKLSSTHRRILEAFYTFEDHHPQLKATFREYLPVLRIYVPREKLFGCSKDEADALLDKAKSLVREAKQSYAKAKKQGVAQGGVS